MQDMQEEVLAVSSIESPVEVMDDKPTGRSFADLGISAELVESLKRHKITVPTKVQEQIIPLIIQGRDVLCSSETGSGKTISFAIPIIDRLSGGEGIRVLVVAPTRELAVQIAKEFRKFSKLHVATVYGGVAMGPQIDKVQEADIVVGTPGRILDLMRQEELFLDEVDFLVLDECDRMFDMGFIDDIVKIIRATPKNRQTLLFSATVSKQVRETSKQYMRDPQYVRIEPHMVRGVLKQSYYVLQHNQKLSLLVHLLRKPEMKGQRVLIFCRTKRVVELVGETLRKYRFDADYMHGDLSQARREKIVEKFKQGGLKVLVATDVAARGLHIDDVRFVVNYDLPDSVETYTHRVGRTARQGRPGDAISLLSAQDFELFDSILRDQEGAIEKKQEEKVEQISTRGPPQPGRRYRVRTFATGNPGEAKPRQQRTRHDERSYDYNALADLD